MQPTPCFDSSITFNVCFLIFIFSPIGMASGIFTAGNLIVIILSVQGKDKNLINHQEF